MKTTLLKSGLAIAASIPLLFGSVKAEDSWYKITGGHRARIEASSNASKLDNTADIKMRNKTTFGAIFTPSKDLEFGIGIANEAQTYFAPRDNDGGTKDKFVSGGVRWSDSFFDKLYVKYKNSDIFPMTFTVGRQNLNYGEGFIIYEASPLDGSRSFHFNAIRGDFEVAPKHNISVFFLYNPMVDDVLPQIDESHEKKLNEYNNNAIGVYYTGKLNVIGLEGYFIRKHTYNPGYAGNADLNNIGARLVFPFTEDFSGATEWVYQMGTSNYGDQSTDLSGLGGYMHLDYNLASIASPLKKFTIGGVYMTGDDPSTTDKVEGFDPLYGRYPKWSESYIYSLSLENGVSYWTNFNSIYANLVVAVGDNADFTLGYQRFGAQYSTKTSSVYRGDLFQSRIDYKINKYLKGHLIWENFRPAGFYPSTSLRYNWVRFQVEYSL